MTRQARLTPVDYDPFARGELARVAPSTEPQRELWLVDRLGTEASLAYNESVSLRLRGALDVDALTEALRAMIARHDALRASFGPDGETFCVAASVDFQLPLIDRSTLDTATRDQRLAQALRDAVDTPFALDTAPLFRGDLLRLDEHDHVLVLTAHHLVCDGWSWWVLVRELAGLYAARLGVAAPPSDTPPTFADYALAEATRAPSLERLRDEKYWLARFTDGAPVLELPTDRPRPARRSFASERIDRVLDAELVGALKRLGGRRGASLFATLLGAFAGLLGRLTGQDDVVIGIPAAGQSVDGHDDLVGHAVNLLPLRCAVEGDTRFAQLLARTQADLLDAYEHQRYTFGTLLQKLRVPRDPSRVPLVSVLFNIDQALDGAAANFPGLTLEFAANARTHENFELFVNAAQVRGELRLETQYNTALFDPATIRRWLAAFESFLRGAVARPEAALGELPLVDVTAREQLAELQPKPVPFDASRLAHEWFEAQVTLTPDRPAVSAGDRSLTHAELDARANRIARLLRTRGIHRGALVGLALDRGIDMLATVLGTLKAGAGYVPLDPAFPAERLRYMASDAGLAALITQSPYLDAFDLRGRPVLALDTLDEELARLDASRLPRDDQAATPDTPAYVIYTSGSTGKPKGVVVPHRTTANFITAMQIAPGMRTDDVLVAVTTLSFDIAFMEMMLPLSVGARLVIASRDEQRDGAALRALVERSLATYLQATPAGWRLLIEAGWQGHASFTAVSGGEPLALDLAEALLARCGAVWNGYGPTETTVYSTMWRVREPRRGIVIGAPVANTTVWIRDARGELAPLGVPGEIWIGGAGVTDGYLGQPALTAERFVADPFSDTPGARLYRTGDRGRWRADGTIEHLGRLDFQVKVRGFRIELGEIETQLAAQPEIARAVVIVREDRAGDARLVAYLVARDGARLDEPRLREALRRVLPDYMLPQHLIALPAIPLLPNGKIDRKALPAPGELDRDDAAHTREPRDALERDVLAALRATLGSETLTLDQDFFERGGHSLLAAQLTARLNREMQLALPLRTLFEAPTAARLAEVIRAQRQDHTHQQRARHSVQPRARRDRAPLSLMQQRLWFLEQLDPGRVTYNTPSAHVLVGDIDLPAFDRAFQRMIERQPALRTTIATEGDEAWQRIHERLTFTLLPVVDLSHVPADARQAELLKRMQAQVDVPFHLDELPLFRATLYRLEATRHVLFFMPHHIIWDGWSFDLLYQEIAALYDAFRQGRGDPLPPLAVDYGDFAQWHLRWMQGEELAAQLAHWRERLSPPPDPLELPGDRPRPARMSGAGHTEWIKLDREQADRVRAWGQSHEATPFMVLLATYFLLLHRSTGSRDLVVGTPVRGRDDSALEPIMGFFVNALPLRVSIDPEQGFTALLRAVRAAVIDAFSYPDVPFEHLVQALNLPRDESRSPLHQALFSYQDVRARPVYWGNLFHERLALFQRGASDDVGLWFVEDDNGLAGGLTYNTDILDASTAQRLITRYRGLLHAAFAAPDTAIAMLDDVPASERAQLQAWNDTRRDYPREGGVPALIAAQARATPDRVAIRQGDSVLTYAQLDASANRLAHALRARGATRDMRVGLMLERTPDLVTSLLAVLKTGAAYVPLDPAFPQERLRYMAEDAGLRVLLGTSALIEPFVQSAPATLLLDRDAAEIDAQSATALADVEAIAPRDPAYVIYTSGSTGQPKGVVVPHGAVVNFLHSMREQPGLRAEDVLVAVTTLSFDIAVLELLLPLTVGAQCVLAPRETALDGRALRDLLDRSRATIMQATPATWRMLLDTGWSGGEQFRALCGGEALPEELAQRLLARTGELWNLYGPTETTVWSTAQRITRDATRIVIGKPIANTSVWIRNEHGALQAIGVPGEIWIGGDGVTLGYWNRPALTAERFVDDPYSDVPGAKLYRTGDRGRWLPDGTIEHLGRLDFQVKLRGFRIELGEIETRLAQHANVSRAVVIVREDAADDPRLVAYVVPRAGTAFDAAALRESLRKHLPDYMVPQHWVPLERIPLLPNGKIDRKALPAPRVSEPSTPVEMLEAPQTPLERALADIWRELLKRDEIGALDNFFDLGGHSLLAVRLFHRAEQVTGVDLPLATLFRAPTIRAMAQRFAQAGARLSNAREAALLQRIEPDSAWSPLVPIQPKGNKPPMFFIHAIGGNVLNYMPLARALGPDQPSYGLQSVGLDGRTPPLERVEDMAYVYAAEIRKLQPRGPYYFSGGSMGGSIALAIAQLLRSQGEHVGLLAMFDTFTPNHLAELRERTGVVERNALLWRERMGRAWRLSATERWDMLRHGLRWRWHRLTTGLRVWWRRRQATELSHDIRYLAVEQANRRAIMRYRATSYDGRIVLFRAEYHHWAPDADPALGWGAIAEHGVEIIRMPGRHEMFVEEPELGARLRAALERAQAEAEGTMSPRKSRA